MFGESDSESPRVPSPWDSLSSTPSPPNHNRIQVIPKLVPEVEEASIHSCIPTCLITHLSSQGNVEYKLQLLSPSPARFTRLVTQLKWRLLEGGGQAYYELGVADSGTLVGLPRQQLEESLETLEMMAGEIGASVIVVKEVEVPPELSNLAESQLERWDGRRSTRRKDFLRMMKQDGSPITSATELETELSNTGVTDADKRTCRSATIPPAFEAKLSSTVVADAGESTCYPTIPPSVETDLSSTEVTNGDDSACHSPITPPTLPYDLVQFRASTTTTTTLPFDPALAMFTVDVGEEIADCADKEAPDVDIPTDFVTEFSVSLEIFSVYKPRPMKKRATYITSPPSTHYEYMKKKLKNSRSPSKSTDTTRHSGDLMAQDSFETPSQPNGAKAQFRRDKWNKGRKLKHNSLLSNVPTPCSTESPTNSADHHTAPSFSTDEPNSSALESPDIAFVDPPTADASGTTITSKEPRLIVEVLVVWKLSLDEAFLDFEGFSL